MITSVFYGVISGLVLLGLAWFCKEILPRIVYRLTSSEPVIGGEWKTTFSEGGKEYHELVKLTQTGRKVSGQIILKLDNEEDAVYRFQGTFKHLTLTGTYESTDPADYERGVFALRYIKGSFVGQHVLLSKETEDLIPSKYVWSRK